MELPIGGRFAEFQPHPRVGRRGLSQNALPEWMPRLNNDRTAVS